MHLSHYYVRNHVKKITESNLVSCCFGACFKPQRHNNCKLFIFKQNKFFRLFCIYTLLCQDYIRCCESSSLDGQLTYSLLLPLRHIDFVNQLIWLLAPFSFYNKVWYLILYFFGFEPLFWIEETQSNVENTAT